MADADADAYTIEEALKQATKLLENQYGKVEQDAAVALATFLYGAHARDVFLQQGNRRTGEIQYE